jgi:hypothetical protein
MKYIPISKKGQTLIEAWAVGIAGAGLVLEQLVEPDPFSQPVELPIRILFDR